MIRPGCVCYLLVECCHVDRAALKQAKCGTLFRLSGKWLCSFVSTCPHYPPVSSELALQGESSPSRLQLLTHPFTRQDWRYSAQLEKSGLMLDRKGKWGVRIRFFFFYFSPCPSSASVIGTWRGAPIKDSGPEAAPALALEQHVSGVGWHHARPASPPTLKQMK